MIKIIEKYFFILFVIDYIKLNFYNVKSIPILDRKIRFLNYIKIFKYLNYYEYIIFYLWHKNFFVKIKVFIYIIYLMANS
jgi:hypothetical protein